MQSQAFQTLGIEPTIDGRTIRDAFVRIARIYHPDRFAGQPDDVRLEAERRMKEASAAYELLKVSNTAITNGQSVFNDKDLQARTRTYRKAMEERQREEDRNRARWARWEAIEKQAREKAEQESALALAAMLEVKGVSPQPVRSAKSASAPHVKADPPKLTAKTPSSALKTRIDAARKQEKEVKRADQRKRSEEAL
ncbi:MAG TPA: DnaJ domain-containing protein [Actinomycetota bacterium]|nr:DnaJ domain-containing protein [Actinomycetota bacterium]